MKEYSLETPFAKIALRLLLIAVVCVAVAATHWQALSAKALSFDDHMYLLDNQLVQNPSWASAKRFLTEVLTPSTVKGYYQPLTMISLILDYAAGGRENNLRPFHVTSLSLHTADTALIIVLLHMLFGNIWAAAAAGLLFGVHPLTVEPIPWIGERKTLLAAFFAFGSLIFYVRYSRTANLKFYVGCFLMYLLALMSKPTSVLLPLVMLLMDYWPLKKLSMKTFFEKLPLFVLGAVFAVITYISQHRAAATISPVEYGVRHILLVLCHNIIFYLHKIILPANLSSYYPFPKPLGLFSPMVLAGVIGTCILIPVLIISLRRTRAVFTGWLIFFVAIFPAMGVVGFTNVIASDKVTVYLPAVGLLMTLTSFLIWLCRNSKAKIITTAVIILLLAGAEAFATQKYLRHWQNTITFCEYMLTLTPDAAPLHTTLGAALMQQNKFDEAIKHFQIALHADPRYVDAYVNLGATYGKMGRFQGEAECCAMAIKIDPTLYQAYVNLGNAWCKLDRNQDAINAYKQAVKIEPDYAAYYNLGVAYGKMGRIQDEITVYREAIKRKPNLSEAWHNLGVAYRKVGRVEDEIEAYKQALKIKPDYAEAYYNLGNAYGSIGRPQDEIEAYRNTIKIEPNYAKAYNNIGFVQNQLGHYEEAIQAFRQAVAVDPGFSQAYDNLGILFNQLGRFQEAADAYAHVVKIKPDDTEAYNSLGWALAQLDRNNEATQAFKQAVQLKPDFVEAHYNLGISLLKTEDVNSAMKEYEILKKLDVEKANNLFNIIHK